MKNWYIVHAPEGIPGTIIVPLSAPTVFDAVEYVVRDYATYETPRRLYRLICADDRGDHIPVQPYDVDVDVKQLATDLENLRRQGRQSMPLRDCLLGLLAGK